MKTFKALRIHRDDGRIQARFDDIGLDDLSPGEVVVRVGWSGINYKDALAATGTSPILRRYPLVGGIDFAGEVETSSHPDWRSGDNVILNGWGLGETHLGAYAETNKLAAPFRRFDVGRQHQAQQERRIEDVAVHGGDVRHSSVEVWVPLGKPAVRLHVLRGELAKCVARDVLVAVGAHEESARQRGKPQRERGDGLFVRAHRRDAIRTEVESYRYDRSARD